MRVVCTVEVLNRLAVAHGQIGKIKPAKGVIQLRNVPGGSVQILISTSKDLSGQRYDVNKIQKLRTTFLKDGMMTIEMREPQMNLMIRNCKPSELEDFYRRLQEIIQGSSCLLSDSIPVSNKSVSVQGNPNEVTKTKSVQKVCGQSMSQVTEVTSRGVKRRLEQLEISKVEVKAIRKSLRKNDSLLVVTARADYPISGFPSVLESISLNKLCLKKIDPRLLTLNLLTVLDISNNRITSIDELQKMDSALQKLVLTNNQIEHIENNVFYSRALRNLRFLGLSENKLKTLPPSILGLTQLQVLELSTNQLVCLPYNLHKLRRLMNLTVKQNDLTFLPFPISILRLSKLDVSENKFRDSIAMEGKSVKVEFSDFPTLFELAVETIATHNYKKPKEAINISPEEVPSNILPYLEYCKYCYRCSRMSLRYSIININIRNSDVASETINSPGLLSFPTKKVVCNLCTFEKF